MPYTDWAEVSHDLRGALELLGDRGFLILGEPVPPSAQRRRLLGGKKFVPARYVQVLRTEDVLSAECVGPASLGGTWEMSPVVVEQLRVMGWRTPYESREEFGTPTPNFDLFVDVSQAVELAELLVASLRLLEATPFQLVLTGG